MNLLRHVFFVLVMTGISGISRVEAVSPPVVEVDVTREGAPISAYIYGQFIEHLGRCIYGGIWAEMLEDRKFYYPVGDGSSPWKSLGPDGAVHMRPEAYVGEQEPWVTCPGEVGAGLVQHGLAVRQGRSYTGYVWLAGDPAAGPVQVRLVWGDGEEQHQTVSVSRLGAAHRKTVLSFAPTADSDDVRLEIVGQGRGSFSVGTVSLMPADHVDGMRADTLALLKELNAPVYRWPGGNFVSGYDWRDGLGDRDRRPPRKNPAWRGVEHNDFGLHEFMRFCREVQAEPLVTVNTGFGDAYSAAAELEYCNGSAETHYGAQRLRNGDPEPFEVKLWCIGNEMWGAWQLGHMKLEHYVQKHNWVVDKMREVDPGIVCFASGQAGAWSKGLLTHCVDHVDLVAEHFYCQEKPDLPRHVAQVPDKIRHKAALHHDYRQALTGLKDRNIRVAMTEWNYWYGPHVFGELGTRYFLKDALGIAAGLHEFYRHSDLMWLATYAQTVNVIGCIKTTQTEAAFATTGLVLKLYRQHYGQRPLEVSGAPAPLDVAAALSADGRRITLSIVNPTLQPQALGLNLNGQVPGAGTVYRIAGADPMLYNEPGVEPRVVIEEEAVSGAPKVLTVPPCSISLYVLAVDPS